MSCPLNHFKLPKSKEIVKHLFSKCVDEHFVISEMEILEIVINLFHIQGGPKQKL